MVKPKTRVIVTVDSNTIFRVLLIILGLLFLYYILDVIIIAFIAFIIVSAITPIVDFWEKFHLPRSLVTFLIYVLFTGGIGYLLSLLVPAVGEQIRQLAHNLPAYASSLHSLQDKFQFLTGGKDLLLEKRSELLTNLGNRLSDEGINIFSQAGSLIKGILNFLAIFSLSFYLSVQKKNVGAYLRAFIPETHREYVIKLVDRIQQKMGYWLLGQMVLNVIVGILVYISLTLLGVPYALLLAIMSGAFEVVPYIGPIVSTFLAVLVALSISPFTALLVLIIYVIIQQAENHLLVPLVMKQAVGINPVAVILAILIGIKLGGALGLVLAIPITAAISVFVSDLITTDTNEKS